MSEGRSGWGVVGTAGTTSGETHGVYGQSGGTAGWGMYGYAVGARDTNYGPVGESDTKTRAGISC